MPRAGLPLESAGVTAQPDLLEPRVWGRASQGAVQFVPPGGQEFLRAQVRVLLWPGECLSPGPVLPELILVFLKVHFLKLLTYSSPCHMYMEFRGECGAVLLGFCVQCGMRVPDAVLPPPANVSTPSSLTPTGSPVLASQPTSSHAIDLTPPSPAQLPKASLTSLDMHRFATFRSSDGAQIHKKPASLSPSCASTRPLDSRTL